MRVGKFLQTLHFPENRAIGVQYTLEESGISYNDFKRIESLLTNEGWTNFCWTVFISKFDIRADICIWAKPPKQGDLK